MFDNTTYLKEVLETHRMCHVQKFVNKVVDRREEIKEIMSEAYGELIYPPFHSGSFAKHTAINIKFDFDLVIPFKHSAFNSLSEMFEDVYVLLSERYKEKDVTIRKQKVSIGLAFAIEDGDEWPVEIDVVPGRELNEDDYVKTGDLNLCFNEDIWGFQKGTRQKTNINDQINHIKGKKTERKVIRLIKIWKKQHNKPYKSFLIELAVIKALDGYNGNQNLWSQLKHSMEYLRDNITDSSFHLYDPGNSNNDVVSAMSDNDKYSFKNDLDILLRNIENNSECYLPYYFKKNEKYAGYENSINGIIAPINPVRFG